MKGRILKPGLRKSATGKRRTEIKRVKVRKSRNCLQLDPNVCMCGSRRALRGNCKNNQHREKNNCVTYVASPLSVSRVSSLLIVQLESWHEIGLDYWTERERRDSYEKVEIAGTIMGLTSRSGTGCFASLILLGVLRRREAGGRRENKQKARSWVAKTVSGRTDQNLTRISERYRKDFFSSVVDPKSPTTMF